MKVIFRVDASIEMGTGHVMRCLSLAEKLKNNNYRSIFVSREHKGNLNHLIKSQGHGLYSLEANREIGSSLDDLNWNKHAHWLGETLDCDSDETKRILKKELPDWLVVDHYALDANWEKEVQSLTTKLMVIDDLADRQHESNLLLDQTYGRQKEDYKGLLPDLCKVLVGSKHSLLRNEFAIYREPSLRRRSTNQDLRSILISMGGSDKDNFTALVLKQLKNCSLPSYTEIKVVLASSSPWIKEVTKISNLMPWKTEVIIDSRSMAELMSKADLSIGAAGSTSWERCCLGLPTIQMVTADNQKFIAESLASAGAIKLLENINELPALIKTAPEWMISVSKKSSFIVDGKGVDRVALQMEKIL